MRKILIAAFAAIMLGLGVSAPTPAQAQETSSFEESQAVSKAIDQVSNCMEKSKQTLCVVREPNSGLRFVSAGLRPKKGAQMNAHVVTVLAENPVTGEIIRNEQGIPFVLSIQTLGNPNWKATLQAGVGQFIGNGIPQILSPIASNLTSPCKNGNCGGGGGSVAYAISGSEANAFLEAALEGGGCATGTCGTPSHGQNGQTAAPKAANDNTIMTPKKAVGQ